MNAHDFLTRPNNHIRLFIYGHGKTKKTWWAAAAASAGFNTLILDMDRGASIIRNLDAAALTRTHVIPCADRAADPIAYQFIREFCRSFDVYFHEKRGATSQKPMRNATRYNLTNSSAPATVLILDSWTALTRSIIQHFSNEHGIDPTDAGKIDWDGYRWSAMMATWVLESLKSLPCHLIVIGHQNTYEKYRGTRRDRRLIFTREQPLSTSNPHGQTISQHFDEVYRFIGRGGVSYIETGGSEHVDGGSRIVAAKTYQWEQFQFATLCKLHGIEIPGPDAPAREWQHTIESENMPPTPFITPKRSLI